MVRAIVISVFVVCDLALTYFLIRWLVRLGWTPLSDRHPARPPAPDAVTRRWQGFRFGLMSLTMHVAADDAHLHLIPIGFLQWLGAETASIPWEAITVVRRSRRGRTVTARVGVLTMSGPAWCLDLADPAVPPAAADDTTPPAGVQ